MDSFLLNMYIHEAVCSALIMSSSCSRDANIIMKVDIRYFPGIGDTNARVAIDPVKIRKVLSRQ